MTLCSLYSGRRRTDRPARSTLGLCTALAIVLLCTAPLSGLAAAEAEPGTTAPTPLESTVDPAEAALGDDLAIVEMTTTPTKEARLAKEKWHKMKYDRFASRREKNGLPAELGSAPRERLVRDPALGMADITSIIPQPEAEALIGEHMNALLSHIPADVPDINILFNDADHQSAIAVSTGQIVFQAGILDDVEFLDQIVFLLAHEVAHIAYDHFKNEENRKTFNHIVMAAALIATGGDVERTAGNDKLMGYMLFSELLLGPQWARSDERAADELAIDLLVANGLSVEGARSMFRSFAAAEARRETLRKERCGNSGGLLGSLLGVNLLKLNENKQPPPECMQAGNILGKVITSITRSHDTAKARSEAIKEYIETRYPNYVSPEMQPLPEPLRVVVAPDGPVLRSLYASRAIEFLNAGQVELAVHYAVAAYREDDTTTVKPRLAMYYLLKRSGRHNEAAQQLEVVIANGQASKAVYMLALQERVAQAVQAQWGSEAERVDALLRHTQQTYRDDPMAALVKAESMAGQNADGSRINVVVEASRLLPPARAAYEKALKLAIRAKDIFAPNNHEFQFQELEIRRILHPDQSFADLTTCSESEDDVVREFCRNALKELENQG